MTSHTALPALDPSQIPALLVLAYGFLFFHLAVFALVKRGKKRIEFIFAALLLDFGLMCSVGGAGAIQGEPAPIFYIWTFALLLALAPLTSLYMLTFLGYRKRAPLIFGSVGVTLAIFGLGFALASRGIPWIKILSLAYADIVFCLLVVGIVEFRDIAILRSRSKKLALFFWSYFGVEIEVSLLCCFQFYEIQPGMRAFWLMSAFTLLAHSLLVRRNPDLYSEYEAQADSSRRGKSRLGSIDIRAKTTLLGAVMSRERPYLLADLSLETLATKLGLSGPQLSELLNQHLGKNFAMYINEFRVEAARKLLIAKPDLGILDVGYECGFSSKSSFNAIFRNSTGLTPSEFRHSKMNF
jgi:AraC-like DNA-binding protein